ncbi:OmpA/MotB domain protein [Rhodomicrobium vannielii ATCC 17100]|uniref:OmpA/MotB domain protein n=1 Tax=Rhodomicrobium vannielii (strain ATCC 17100 / DSM 162 / LMG 4299 / NCIMB 10020 / ATH 3.1.1) TaxID=648757 RepID=E3I625_RHOVT|nr:phosphate ABC transporter substrate-binding/OmpA family protein [Rhodomicrobium vannielii]ADP70618.1 OmpA/MotB domain protein [Rhodomicrobium vannielii ATCC 17100]
MSIRNACRASASLLALAASFAPVNAEDVTLTLRGGGLTVIGELVAADAASFVIRSDKFGMMALESAKFECNGPSCPKPLIPSLGIHGSNTIGAQLMPNTVERFAEEEGFVAEKVVGADPEEVVFKFSDASGKDVASIDIKSHGSGTAPKSLIEGKAQIGAMSRPIKEDEAKAVADAGVPLKTHVFALDGIVVFVSPKNPVKTLSLEQIAKIFSGDIKDWKDVGGNPGPIHIYARDAKSGTFDTFNTLVLSPLKLKLSPGAKRFESNHDLSDETARDPNGIGFSGFAYIRNAKPLSVASNCGIVSTPDVFSVKTEEYPLSRRLYLYSGKAGPLGDKLIAYALSDKAQDIISEAGFINQHIDLQTFDQQAGRVWPAFLVAEKDFSFALMRDLTADVKSGKRLSVNFRFHRNSAVLDDKAMQDVPRLARFLKSDANGKDLLLLGFTDGTGAFETNKALSLNRATSFKNALVAEGVPANKITVKGYGSLLPVGCNTSDAGQSANRRVEVWMKD